MYVQGKKLHSGGIRYPRLFPFFFFLSNNPIFNGLRRQKCNMCPDQTATYLSTNQATNQPPREPSLLMLSCMFSVVQYILHTILVLPREKWQTFGVGGTERYLFVVLVLQQPSPGIRELLGGGEGFGGCWRVLDKGRIGS